MNNGAGISCGSALARNGAVTLNNNVIGGNCGARTVTPEPGSLFLMGTGLVGIAGMVRRKLKLAGSVLRIGRCS
jgi:hypothetical protein